MNNQNSQPEAWKLIKSEDIVDTPWFKMEDNLYDVPGVDKDKQYYILRERPGCNIVAVTENKEVIVISQYRPTIDAVVYDFPAGYVEDNDPDKLTRAKSELLEETGFGGGDWKEIGYAYALPNRSDKRDFFFLAKNVKKISDQNLEEFENIKYELWSVEKLLEKIKSNEFSCGICISSWYHATLADPTLLN